MKQLYLVEEGEVYDRAWMVYKTFATFNPEKYRDKKYKLTKIEIR